MDEKEISGSSTDDECARPKSDQEAHGKQISSDYLERNEDRQTSRDARLPLVESLQALAAGTCSGKPTDERSPITPQLEENKSQKKKKPKRVKKGKKKASNSDCQPTASSMEYSATADCPELKIDEGFPTSVDSFSEDVKEEHESVESNDRRSPNSSSVSLGTENNPEGNTDSHKNFFSSESSRPNPLEKQDSTVSEPRSLRTLASCESLKTEEVAREWSEQSSQATTSAGSEQGKKEYREISNTDLGSLPTSSTSDSSRTEGTSSESGLGSYWTQTTSELSAETEPESQVTVDLEIGGNPFERIPQDCQYEADMQVIPPAVEIEMEAIPPAEVCQVENPPPPYSHGYSSDLHGDAISGNEATGRIQLSAHGRIRPVCSGKIAAISGCCVLVVVIIIVVLLFDWLDKSKGKRKKHYPRRFH